MSEPKFPNVKVKLAGEDGNAYAIMGQVGKALKKGGATPEQLTQYINDSKSGDYDNLLRVAMDWVNVS